MRWGLQVPDIMLGGFSVLVPGRRGDNRNLDDGYSGRDHHLIVRSNEIKFLRCFSPSTKTFLLVDARMTRLNQIGRLRLFAM